MKFTVLLLALAGLSAQAIAQDAYKAPVGEEVATIIGSRPISSTKKAPLVFVLGVDGKKVSKEVGDWDKPLAITPGKHLIAIGIRDLYEEFEIDACAGCTYQALGSYEEQVKTFMKLMNIELWIAQEPNTLTITEHKKPKPRPLDIRFNFHFAQ